jgi:hypothetical protein
MTDRLSTTLGLVLWGVSLTVALAESPGGLDRRTREKIEACTVKVSAITGPISVPFSGFVIESPEVSGERLILTCFHGSKSGSKARFEVEHEREPIECDPVAYDEWFDLLVLKPKQNLALPALKIAEGDANNQDEGVYVFGFPSGINARFQRGYINGKDQRVRDFPPKSTPIFELHDDAELVLYAVGCSMGYSGGPVVNLKGEVVAIHHGILHRRTKEKDVDGSSSPGTDCFGVSVGNVGRLSDQGFLFSKKVERSYRSDQDPLYVTKQSAQSEFFGGLTLSKTSKETLHDLDQNPLEITFSAYANLPNHREKIVENLVDDKVRFAAKMKDAVWKDYFRTVPISLIHSPEFGMSFLFPQGHSFRLKKLDGMNGLELSFDHAERNPIGVQLYAMTLTDVLTKPGDVAREDLGINGPSTPDERKGQAMALLKESLRLLKMSKILDGNREEMFGEKAWSMSPAGATWVELNFDEFTTGRALGTTMRCGVVGNLGIVVYRRYDPEDREAYRSSRLPDHRFLEGLLLQESLSFF